MKKLFLMLSLLCSLASPVFAQSSQPLAQAQQHFQDAEAFYSVQEYEKALSAYKDAYLLSKEPDLLYNIGNCQRLLNRYDDAIRSYKGYIAQGSEPEYKKLSAEFIAELQGLLDSGVTKDGLKKAELAYNNAQDLYNLQQYQKALELYQESYRLSKQPEILFYIGHCQMQLKQYEEALKSYNTFLTARHDEEARSQTEVRIKELLACIEEQRRVEAEQRRLQEEQAASQSATAPALQHTELPAKKKPARILLYSGAASIAGGLAFGAIALNQANKVEDLRSVSFGDAVDFQRIEASSDRVTTLTLISGGLFAVGTAALLTAPVLSLRRESNAVVNLSPRGVSLALSF